MNVPMTGFFTTRNTAVAQAPTPAQINWFQGRGIAVPVSREEAAKTMASIIASEETRTPSRAQLGMAYMSGVGLGWAGKDLPGAGVREISTQIALLQAVEQVQRALLDDNKSQEDVDSALHHLIGKVLERFAKPMPVERRTARAQVAESTAQAEAAPM